MPLERLGRSQQFSKPLHATEESDTLSTGQDIAALVEPAGRLDRPFHSVVAQDRLTP
jgi:hypothetical protein